MSPGPAWEYSRPMDRSVTSGPNLVPGRSCEGCTLCCKLLNIASLDKPRLVWCQHCEIGVGCRIYERRPRECQDFYCTYRVSPELGEEWKPSVSKMVVNFESRTKRVNVSVDPDFADAWRREPYYTQIKAMALHMLRRQGHLIVWEGAEAIAILPDREVPLGATRDNVIVVRGRMTPDGEEYDAFALTTDDPRLKDINPG
jgi:hypothetical protein